MSCITGLFRPTYTEAKTNSKFKDTNSFLYPLLFGHFAPDPSTTSRSLVYLLIDFFSNDSSTAIYGEVCDLTKHMQIVHDFDYSNIKKQLKLGFYQQVYLVLTFVLINWPFSFSIHLSVVPCFANTNGISIH